MTFPNDSNSAELNSAAPAPDEWQATRAQTIMATQFLGDENDYLAQPGIDIGRQVGANERELFVSCDPAQAMRQQFEHLHPEFIAIHDIATNSSRKLLAGVATASGCAIQKLTIRRQGYGTALATIEFIELRTVDGAQLKVYSTEVDADTSARHGLARVLLGFSRLGVVMMGELPPHAVASSLKPLQEAMLAGPWPNRQMLLLPLASLGTLAVQSMALSRETGVSVRTTPLVTRPVDAWNFVNGTWNRLREQEQPDGREMPELDETDTGNVPAHWALVAVDTAGAPATGRPKQTPASGVAQKPSPLPMRPMPATSPTPVIALSVLDRYVQKLSELPGMVSCCIFNVTTGLTVVHAGASPGAVDLAKQGTDLLSAIGLSSRKLGLGHALPEAAITFGSHHMLIRAVPNHAGLALNAVLDKSQANLTLARLQVLRMDALFEAS
jgi:hypothetical protein